MLSARTASKAALRPMTVCIIPSVSHSVSQVLRGSYVHTPAAYPKKMPTQTTPATSLTPIIPMTTMAHTAQAVVMVMGAPMWWAMKPEERRPMNEQKLRITSWAIGIAR